MSAVLFLSCEHGGNRTPPAYRSLFKGVRALLDTHRGYDPGALHLFGGLKPLAKASTSNTLTRLLIEFNRAENSPDWFSAFSRELPPHLKQRLIHAYRRYRHTFRARMERALADGHRVLHVSVHTFTPVMDGKVRPMDIGLLFDPGRTREKALCQAWRSAIRLRAPGLRVARNRPYTGTSDGFTRELRHHLPARAYQGIELEVNQRHVKRNRLDADVASVLKASLEAVLRGQ